LSHGRRDLLPPGVAFVPGDIGDRQALENLLPIRNIEASLLMAFYTLPLSSKPANPWSIPRPFSATTQPQH